MFGYDMAGISQYQLWIAAMLAGGFTPAQIAEQRGVKRQSVTYEIRLIYAKTGFSTKEQIVAWARENSLDDPSILEVPKRRRINPKMRGFFGGQV